MNVTGEHLTGFLVFVPFWCDLIMSNKGKYHNTLQFLYTLIKDDKCHDRGHSSGITTSLQLH